MGSINIRPAQTTDLHAITGLCSQLGYESSISNVRERFERISRSGGHAVFVALSEAGSVIGWIHVFEALRVESNPFAELGGFVVDVEHRQRGIGRQLLDRAESWAADRGLPKIRVRSRSGRADAHAFYTTVGFGVTKQQTVFDKPLT